MGASYSTLDIESFFASEDANKCVKIPTEEGERSVYYAEVGDKNGKPIMVLPGLGTSRFFSILFDAAGKKYGARIVCVEFPGIGRSDPQANRTFEQWTKDMVHITDSVFGAGCKYGVLGISAGGTHTLACAASPFTRDRVVSISLLGPWVSLSTPGVSFFKKFGPWVPSILLSAASTVMVTSLGSIVSRQGVKALRKQLSAHEQETLDSMGDVADLVMRKNVAEVSAHHGTAGFSDLFLMCCEKPNRPFNIDFNEIRQPVTLFAGTADEMVSYEAEKYLHSQLKNASVDFVTLEKATHEGMVLTHTEEAVQAALKGFGQ